MFAHDTVLTLATVLDRHTAALGGVALTGVQIHFRVIEPTFEAEGVYAAERERMRVDILIGGQRVFTEGYINGHGWQRGQEDAHGSPSSPAGSQALLRGIENHLCSLTELIARGHHLELVGHEVIHGIEYIVIKVVYTDGHTVWRYLNSLTWLIERSREHKALHPDVNPTPTTIETVFTDFRDVGGGLRRPFHETQTDLTTNALLQTTLVQQVVVNPLFDAAFFDCP